MSVNNGNRTFNAGLIAVLAALLWGVDGYKVVPTKQQAMWAAALIGVALIMGMAIKKAMNRIKDPEAGRKNEATIMVVVSSFVLAAVGWVALMGWAGYAPRHAFAGMVTVLALGVVWRHTRHKDELLQDGAEDDSAPDDPAADKAKGSEKAGKRGRELADASA